MFHLFLVTPEKVLFDGDVYSIMAPGEMGFFEVLTNHASMIALLHGGQLVVTDTNKQKHQWHVSGGFFEVSHNQASVMVDCGKEDL